MAERQHDVRAIDAHGVIGDMRTCALVADDGCIDYLCWPNLDSPSVFTALLDGDEAGLFSIVPELPDARRQQLYLPESNVLQTRWLDDEGAVELTDWMPVQEKESALPRLIRRVYAVKGNTRIRLKCSPRLDYARAETTASLDGRSVVFAAEGQRSMRLVGSVPLTLEGATAVAHFTLNKNESATFIFGCAEDRQVMREDPERCLEYTLAFWRRWSRQSQYRGRWRELVMRSALVLKLLVSRQHGSIAAAATFGLPESPGGERNWDYRATWIRDASFTVYAFMRLGFKEEAHHFMHWVGGCLERSSDIPHKLQIMYRLDGGRELPEQELDHLNGHGGAKPVRIGNDAFKQVQLDIYGELMDAVYLSNKYDQAISHRGWKTAISLIDYLCDHWRSEDAGIWEIRSGNRHFLHSRLMCWVAIDRAIRLAQKRSLSMPYERWLKAREDIKEDIWTHFWNKEKGRFNAVLGQDSLDASMLLMPLFRFVGATDPAWLATLDAIKERLVCDGMVKRYDLNATPDGLQSEEGAFTACSFWYVECLARAGRTEEAHMEFEKLIGYASPLGLFSEELDARGRHLGNTPQALTHLALISAAYFLDRKLSGSETHWQP
ncbi:glycoside hydrolase family 15 protein [Stutzerimonas azotifigens]|uniref:Glycoside hydrolase family 15 protein n=1 Tax=Stutzerimonas azotifigens TaxID=291995 RepID=A0ABR5Z7B8_9GAMM|nr:glycoside hydrolase family 15 protein [Stutzerimonas azotifigens]MBA1276070.1 glycoside hydrolase family 15 protein [Stutzerimonas azotifigens]